LTVGKRVFPGSASFDSLHSVNERAGVASVRPAPVSSTPLSAETDAVALKPE
jgi:hypothetical protein